MMKNRRKRTSRIRSFDIDLTISHPGEEHIRWSVVECLVFLSIKVIFVSSRSFSSSNKDGTEIHCTCSMKNELHTCFIFKSTWSSSYSFDLLFERLHDDVRSFFFLLLLIKWKISLFFLHRPFIAIDWQFLFPLISKWCERFILFFSLLSLLEVRSMLLRRMWMFVDW